MISKKERDEILNLCVEIDKEIKKSSGDVSPTDTLNSMHKLRGYLPTLAHKASAVDALVLQVQREILNDEYWKQIKTSSTLVKDFAINKYPDLRDCKLRLDHLLKILVLVNAQLVTELSYYKAELHSGIS